MRCRASLTTNGETVQCERQEHSDSKHEGTAPDGKRITWRSK